MSYSAISLMNFPQIFPAKISVSTGISVILHAALFLFIGHKAVSSAQFGVQSGNTTFEIHLVAGPTARPDIYENEFNAEINRKRKKPLVKPSEFASTVDSGKGKSAQNLQSSQSGAITEAKPNYLKNPAPVYPARARNQGQQGLVEIEAEINGDGSVKNLRLKKSSGSFLLDDAAMAAVRQWEFMPASRDGIAVASLVMVPVRFKIGNGTSEISLKD